MVEANLLGIGALLLGLGAWSGGRRAVRGQAGWLLAIIAFIVSSAWLCWVIGENTTGRGYLSGIVGVVMSIVMLICGGGAVVGALIGWLIRVGESRRYGHSNERTEIGMVDLVLVGLLGVAAIGLSLTK